VEENMNGGVNTAMRDLKVKGTTMVRTREEARRVVKILE
jgi:hypothetical protein